MLKILVKIILLSAVAIVAWPITSEAEVFQNVDQKTWECMKADSERVHKTIYTSEYPEPADRQQGSMFWIINLIPARIRLNTPLSIVAEY